MGNCCKAASSMEWGGDDWESLKQPNLCSSSSSKVFDEAAYLDHHHNKETDVLGKLRASCDGNGKVTLKISKCELAELLEAIKKKKKESASGERVLFQIIKAREHETANKHHCSSHWKPMLDTIREC